MPIWLAAFIGKLDVGAYWPGAIWHGHEMVFGFVIAVIAGFLLTAVGNWTGHETAIGKPLMALAGIWVLGRLGLSFSAELPALLVAVVDLAFIPALAVAIGRPLIGTGNKRNFVFLGLLAAFWTANLVMHLEALGVMEGVARPALLATVDLTLLVTLIIGGRIIPLFTRNATSKLDITNDKWADRATLIAMVLVLLTAAFGAPNLVVAPLSLLAGLLVFVRMRKWGTLGTFRQPILWVLHLGHAWIGVGLILRAASHFGLGVAPTFATHVLTIGAIGTLIIGMMTRVSRGHTGRSLVVSKPIVAAYLLVTAAVITRALFPLALPDLAWTAYLVSGAAWCAAFAIFLWKYVPVLVTPRADA